jgi:hypothetical protein
VSTTLVLCETYNCHKRIWLPYSEFIIVMGVDLLVTLVKVAIKRSCKIECVNDK